MLLMEYIPTELLQLVNDELDFFDQIKFKNICKNFYNNIQIKQYGHRDRES